MDHNNHKIKIKDWLEMDTSERIANRFINLGWCFGIAAVLYSVPGLINAISQALK
jgi:hypothetical protein